MYSSTLGGQFDVKSADELVASSRLNVIEREHKSFGSLIDHRQLFALDETPRPARKVATSTDGTAALSNFWKSAAYDQGQSTAKKVIEDSMSSSSNVISHSYANEELIWRTKSSVDKYFQKRAYEDPTLQTFRDNLSADQKRRNKELTLKALHNLADKYRAEMAKVKEEMDIDGVFHPAANAHRVHCMYLMKIYKGISAQTIEDPVLRRLRAETISKKVAEDAEEDRKQLLLRIATIGREGAEQETIARRSSLISLPASVSTSTKDPMFSPGPASGRKEAGDKERGETRANSRRQSRSLSREESPAKNNRRVSIGGAVPLFQGNRRSSETTSAGGAGIASDRNSNSKVMKEKGEEETTDDISSSSPGISQLSKWNHDAQEPSMSSNTAANGGSIPHMDKLMFNKMRQKRLGAVDSRSLLPDEANRLENASITDPKKSKHRSSLINNENTTWMLEKLQHSSGGPGVKPPIDREGREREKEGGHQADIVPFEEFHKMFEEYSAATAKEKARAKRETDGPSPSPRSNKDSRSSSSGNSRRISLMEPGNDEDKLDSDAAMSAVQYLAKEDPLFESFLKMSLRDRSTGRRLTRVSASNLMEPKMKRVPAPLGLSAVQLDPLTSNHHTPTLVYDNHSGSLLPNGTTGSSIFTSNFFTGDGNKVAGVAATGGGGKVANYMAATRQGTDLDRHQRGSKALGFSNCFQSQEMLELSSVFKQSSDLLQNEDSVNGFKDRRIQYPGPDPQGSIVDVTDPANIAVKSLNQTQGNTRTMVLQRRRHEREREREEDGDSPRGDRSSRLPKTAAETENQASAMQRKLVQMWDCLQVPASERLDFMRKFSLYPYSMRLGIATDLWAEVAVLVMARQEIMKMIAVIKSGFRRMPLLASELIDSIYLAVPLDLSSRSSVFLPLSIPVSVKTERGRIDSDSESSKRNRTKMHPVPLSAAALSSMTDHVNSRFASFAESNITTGEGGTSEERRGSNPSKLKRKSSLQSLMNALQPGRSRSRKTSTEGSMKVTNNNDDEEEEEEKETIPLQIKSEEDATSCLLHLKKTVDQLLLAALKKTLDEVSDVVTYGKVSVQEWMSEAPEFTATPFDRRL